MAKAQSLVERIFLELRFGVLAAHYLPGQIISKDQVCEVYDCRAVMAADALGALVAEGYLSRHGRGEFTVRTWTRAEITDLYDMRASLEAIAAARAAERASEAQISWLQSLVGDAGDVSATNPDDLERVTLSNLEFHLEVRKMARIPRFAEMSCLVLPNALHRLIVWSQRGEDGEHSARTHRKIAAAIAERSSSMARLLMREDVYSSREAVLAAIDSLVASDAPPVANIRRMDQTIAINGRTFGQGTREPAADGRTIAFGAPLS